MTRVALDRIRRLVPGRKRGAGPRGPEIDPSGTAAIGDVRPGSTGPLPKSRDGVLGVEIAVGGLRFVELGRAGGRPVLRNHGVVAYGNTEELSEVLRMIVGEFGVRAKDVHVVDSTCRANLKVHRMPDIPDADLDAIVGGEILAEADLLGEPLVGDWCRLRTRDREAEILVGKVPVADRAGLVAACGSAGLRLQALTSSSVVLARHLLVTGQVPAGETIGLLDIGRSKTNMALLTGEHVRLVREVYQGVTGSFLKRDAGAAAEVDLEAIGAGLDEVVGTVEQIRRTWQQYQSQNPESSLHHVVMTGETTRISQLIGLLQHDLRVPVRTWDPSSAFGESGIPEDFRRTAATYAVPWVLATTPARRIELNFAEGVPDLRPVRVAQGVVAGAVVGLLAAGALQLVDGRRLEARAAELAAAEASKAELEVELGLLEEVHVLWNDWLRDRITAAGLPTADLRPHLVELIGALPPDLKLTRVSFHPSGPVWRLEADAIATRSSARESHGVMEEFVTAIARSPLVHDVSMRPLAYEKARGAGAAPRFEFTLLASLREAAAATGEVR